ncbi:GEVED domain-containing protein [Bizionia arctica]|uniref:T9SS type A sorting domain-containing protein n=1 Tax=Bizionia arctica TaxID=1495645 RepID=A0A917GNQ7_9FLAO|nr:GEVED domain-containing protein [Bizionia arctica]GGG52762.1 hypothetical protein GCM10010976_24820 [Bizionia arctica]
MKKTTLVFGLALLTYGVHAQTFPSPYCAVDPTGTSTEEITMVDFGGTVITNTDDTSISINEISTIVNVSPDETYALEVAGNTYGPFDTDIVAFIDWNHNDILDDAGEIYEIGTITNSTGSDGVSVMMDITVPTNAMLGTTRIRITKIYQDPVSPADINPCAIGFFPNGSGPYPGFGQALDFSLDVALPFPSPYCAIDATGTSTEEITMVDFGGTVITNTDDTSISINEISTIVDVSPDETYTLEVAGNTYGPFDTDIVAFIDWNHNDILDDAGEIYEIGTLYNSTGNDGVSVMMDITVPTNAMLGTTRIRITKIYQDPVSPADINPCAIGFFPNGTGPYPGFGQALDFTLNLAPLSVETFDVNSLSAYPIPTTDVLNVTYKSVINAVKIYNLLGQEVFAKNTQEAKLQLDVSSLKTGAYFVMVFAEEGQHTFRIIKH